jgi:Na+/alanine symporter
LTGHRYLMTYNAFTSFIIFLGTLVTVESVWTLSDYLLPLVVLPNVCALLWISRKQKLYL